MRIKSKAMYFSKVYEVKATILVFSYIWICRLARRYYQARQARSPFFFYDLQLREVSRLVSL